MTKVFSTIWLALLVMLSGILYGQSETADRTLLPEPSGLKNDIFYQTDSFNRTVTIVSTIHILNLLQNFGTQHTANFDLNGDGKIDEEDLSLLLGQREEQE